MKAFISFFTSLALYALIASLCSAAHIAGFFCLLERFAWIRQRGIYAYGALSFLVSTAYFAPLVLFPLGAYLSRNAIYALTPSSAYRMALILVFMSGSALFMRISDAGAEHIRTFPRSRYTQFASIVKEARHAPVNVSILRATLLNDTGQQGEIQLEIAIDHIPQSVQSYRLEISNGPGFSRKWGTTVSAEKHDEHWVFHKRKSHEILTDEAGSLILVHPFGRSTDTPPTVYPVELYLRLLLIGEAYRVSDTGQIPFFERKFPVQLTRTEQPSSTQ